MAFLDELCFFVAVQTIYQKLYYLFFFLDAVEKYGLWPSRIRVDRGVENVLVYDAIVDAR